MKSGSVRDSSKTPTKTRAISTSKDRKIPTMPNKSSTNDLKKFDKRTISNARVAQNGKFFPEKLNTDIGNDSAKRSSSYTRRIENMPSKENLETNSICSRCKAMDVILKNTIRVINHVKSEMMSLNEAEELWRNGEINFDADKLGSYGKNESDVKNIFEIEDFYSHDYGKYFYDLQVFVFAKEENPLEKSHFI